MSKKGRAGGVDGCAKSVAYIGSIAFQKIAFCDATITLPDGFNPTGGRIAAWSAEQCRFVVKNVELTTYDAESIGKRDGITLLELLAIQLAAKEFPDCQIYSDSRSAICFAEKLGIASPAWIPRELNGIANLLAKGRHLEGRGYVIFNESTPRRGWIFFDFEKG